MAVLVAITFALGAALVSALLTWMLTVSTRRLLPGASGATAVAGPLAVLATSVAVSLYLQRSARVDVAGLAVPVVRSIVVVAAVAGALVAVNRLRRLG